MEFQSLRKGLIAKTPRVTSCAGAAGVGSVFGMAAVYRGGVMSLKEYSWVWSKVYTAENAQSILRQLRDGGVTIKSHLRRIRTIAFIALSFVVVAPSAQAIEPIRNIQIDVISINTSFGSESVTEANSRAIIDKVNAGFDDVAGGLVHFTLRRVLPSITPGTPVLTSTDVGTIAGGSIKTDPGFEKVVLIGVIAKNLAIRFAGQAGGSFMLINGDWSTNNANTVAHELGHNMGLDHANSAVCTNTAPIVCDQNEYGDYSSVMGTNVLGWPNLNYVARFSATEIDHLKVLPDNKRAIAVESGEFKLAPVYSKNIDLPKVVYIPIGNEMSYSIEYRPAVGPDSALAQSQITLNGSNSYYTNIPSHGIQLRILNVKGKSFSSIQPKVSNFPNFETALLVDSFTSPQVQPIGKSFNLSDGSTITFVSADPNTAAVVKIVRPADTEAPTIPSINANWPYVRYYLGPKGERLVQHKSAGVWDYPKLTIPVSTIVENRMIKTLDLEINGQIVDSLSNSALINSKEFEYQTTTIGNFAVRLIATDYAGNKAQSEISNYLTDYYYLSKPGVGTEIGPDPLTSVKFSFYKANDDVTYQVSELSAGTLKSIEIGKRLVEVTVVDIPRNTTITAKLIGSNASGETDGGQIISGTPEIAECTNTNCFVGLPWKIETGFFTPGSGVMSLQEKIAGKWVPIKSSKPILGKSPYKKYPVGYEISLSYSAPGKHTYRLVIAPSKKLGSYTGPVFTQVVKP